MENAFLIGDKLYLRALLEEDADGPYLNWLNDRQVTRYLESGFFPAGREALLAYIKALQGRTDAVILAIVEGDSQKHIGNIKLEPIRWIHRTAELGILIGDKESWGRGYASQAMQLMLDYAFLVLNLRKITLGVVAENVAAVRLYEKSGFVIEGRRREQTFHNGHYCDEYLMGLMKSEYLERKKGVCQ